MSHGDGFCGASGGNSGALPVFSLFLSWFGFDLCLVRELEIKGIATLSGGRRGTRKHRDEQSHRHHQQMSNAAVISSERFVAPVGRLADLFGCLLNFNQQTQGYSCLLLTSNLEPSGN